MSLIDEEINNFQVSPEELNQNKIEYNLMKLHGGIVSRENNW